MPSQHHRECAQLAPEWVEHQPQRLQRGSAQQVAVALLAEDDVRSTDPFTVSEKPHTLLPFNPFAVSQTKLLLAQGLVQRGDRIAVVPESDTKSIYRDYLEADVFPGQTLFVERGGIERARNIGARAFYEIVIELKD